MRIWILSQAARLLGIQFKVDGLPHGARPSLLRGETKQAD